MGKVVRLCNYIKQLGDNLEVSNITPGQRCSSMAEMMERKLEWAGSKLQSSEERYNSGQFFEHDVVRWTTTMVCEWT